MLLLPEPSACAKSYQCRSLIPFQTVVPVPNPIQLPPLTPLIFPLPLSLLATEHFLQTKPDIVNRVK